MSADTPLDGPPLDTARAALWASLRLVVTPGAALAPRWQGTPPRANELVRW